MDSVETSDEEFVHWYDEELHKPIDPEDYCRALLNEMGLERTDVFKTDEGPLQVRSIHPAKGSLRVNDPTIDHPQDARAETRHISIRDLYRDWKRGKAVPATLSVTTDA